MLSASLRSGQIITEGDFVIKNSNLSSVTYFDCKNMQGWISFKPTENFIDFLQYLRIHKIN